MLKYYYNEIISVSKHLVRNFCSWRVYLTFEMEKLKREQVKSCDIERIREDVE